ncbi:MAG: hypothetical protein NC084_11970 [Bacteroides sp.]|nr:hypothetical protein [Eubacterium sp.]MCM1419303.1 hypothetical protein [Roseburia sp.]MCM1463409.1 hypothetical protein [Bacteroides sp.]
MARLKVSGFAEEVERFKQAGGDTQELIKAMLDAGIKVAKAEWKDVILKRRHLDTGDMRNSVDAAWVSYRNGAAEVYPLGTSRTGSVLRGNTKPRKPIRNAEKAFIIHYGRSNLAGDLFVDQVEEQVTDKGFDAMREVYDEFLEKEGL